PGPHPGGSRAVRNRRRGRHAALHEPGAGARKARPGRSPRRRVRPRRDALRVADVAARAGRPRPAGAVSGTRNGGPGPPRAAPTDREPVVLRAMARGSAERYATAQDLADALQRFLDDKPIRAKRPTPAQRAKKWVRRHPAAGAAAVVVLVLTAVASSVATALVWAEKEQTRREKERAEANFKLALSAVAKY